MSAVPTTKEAGAAVYHLEDKLIIAQGDVDRAKTKKAQKETKAVYLQVVQQLVGARHQLLIAEAAAERVEALFDVAAADAQGVQAAADRTLDYAIDSVRRIAGYRQNSRNGVWQNKDGSSCILGEALNFCLDHADSSFDRKDGSTDTYRSQAGKAFDRYWAAHDAAVIAHSHVVDFNRAYYGWSRFFIVRNHGGHIHSSLACSTCRPTTEFGWTPELSGLDEAHAVAAYGAILCTVCFPSAPVEFTSGVSK